MRPLALLLPMKIDKELNMSLFAHKTATFESEKPLFCEEKPLVDFFTKFLSFLIV